METQVNTNETLKIVSEYTKGNWATKEGQIYSEQTGKTHALIPYFDSDNKEDNTNASLIAAAPELLKACIDTLRILELNPTNTNLYQRNKLEYLIKKATNNVTL